MRTELAVDLPKIMVDRVQLQQVLMNLMLNAIETMKDSGGELTVKSQLQDGQLQFSVSDTGVGCLRRRWNRSFLRSLPRSRKAAAWGWPSAVPLWSRIAGGCGRPLSMGRGATFHFTLPTHMTETSTQVDLVA
jgi:light-regulated signal transduction histidine kinase (bacteriophytochrome)